MAIIDNDDFVFVWKPNYEGSREVLYLDYRRSPSIIDHYTTWKTHLKSTDLKEILLDLMKYLFSSVFDISQCTDHQIHEIIKSHITKERIPLELFIQEKKGLCRHFVFIAYFFIDQLRQEHIIDIASLAIGSAFVLIGNERKRHAWLVVDIKNRLYSLHFDPFWGLLLDNADPIDRKTIENLYICH